MDVLISPKFLTILFSGLQHYNFWTHNLFWREVKNPNFRVNPENFHLCILDVTIEKPVLSFIPSQEKKCR